MLKTRFKYSIFILVLLFHFPVSIYAQPYLGIEDLLSLPYALNEEARSELPYFELTAYSSNADVNKPDQIWDFSTFSLYRKENYGAFGGVVNYSSRNNVAASQFYINLIPKLGESCWVDFGYGLANSPEIFPDNTWSLEGYKRITGSLIASFGDTYKTIESTYFHTITGSIAHYVGHYYFSFRPLHYIPKRGPKSTLFRFEIKKYWDNPDKNIGLILATGTSPDLFDLRTLNFFKVRNNIIFLQGQQPIHKALSFIYGAGYETQEFPNTFVRRLAYFNIGIKLRKA